MQPFTGNEFFELFRRLAVDIYPGRYTQEYCEKLAVMASEAVRILQEKRILLLVHNYQYPELQEVARRSSGYIGDSYGLTLKARDTEYQQIAFCSVEFMAKTAKILLPERTVLIPARPGCSLVASINLEEVRQWKHDHLNSKVISYINTDDLTKAESYIICTSRNAAKVTDHVRKSFPGAPLLFLPDKYLAAYVMRKLGMQASDMDVWDGACHVHQMIGEFAMLEAVQKHPNAELLIHPECGCTSSCLVRTIHGEGYEVPMLSTEGMILRAKESAAKEFIVATEIGMVYRLRRDIPEKTFHPAFHRASCEYMKMITLENLLECLRNFETDPRYAVEVDAAVAKKARAAIERMTTIA